MLTRRRLLLGVGLGLVSLAAPRIGRAQAVPNSLLVRPPGSIPQGIPLGLDPNDPINNGSLLRLLFGSSGAFDLTERSNNASYVNGPTTVPTAVGNGIILNGTNQYALVNNNISSSFASLNTIYLVFIPYNNNIALLGKRNSVSNFPFVAYLDSLNVIQYYVDNGTTFHLDTTNKVAASQINTFIASRNGSSVLLMLNGVVTSGTLTAGSDNSSPVTIGCQNAGSGFIQFLNGVVIEAGISAAVWSVPQMLRFTNDVFAGLTFASDRVPLWGVNGAPSFTNRPMVRPIFTLQGG